MGRTPLTVVFDHRSERRYATVLTRRCPVAAVISVDRTEYVYTNPVSRHIVLMRTNVINLLNRVPEHDSLTFSCCTELNVNQCILNRGRVRVRG